MALTLRLPDDLAADAKQRCARLGISLNALVCVALDAYLGRVAVDPLPPAAPVAAEVLPSPGQALSRRERKRLAAQAHKLKKGP